MKQIRLHYTKKTYDDPQNPDKVVTIVRIFDKKLSSWFEIVKLMRDHDVKYFSYSEEDIPEQQPLKITQL